MTGAAEIWAHRAELPTSCSLQALKNFWQMAEVSPEALLGNPDLGEERDNSPAAFRTAAA